MTLQELTEQATALSMDERLALISAIRESLKGYSPREHWLFLESRPDSWRKQLYIKGRKLRASNIWSDMIVNEMTPEECAEDWDLPLAAIHEAIEYCEIHQGLIEAEAAQERASLDTNRGSFLEPTFAN